MTTNFEPIPAEVQLLTIADVARALRCSRQTVYDEARAGRLRMVRFGERRRVLRRDLDAYLSGLQGSDDSR